MWKGEMLGEIEWDKAMEGQNTNEKESAGRCMSAKKVYLLHTGLQG